MPPDIGDHHPHNLDLPATCSHSARFSGREPVAHEDSQHFDLETGVGEWKNHPQRTEITRGDVVGSYMTT
jgi:uncharacterized protein involved in high-affinity Fe2+ transport